jgi:hypothetical protein
VVQGQTVIVPVTASGLQAQQLSEGQLRAAVVGKSVADARTYLAQFGQVDISVTPGWASTLPSFDFRIDFRLVEASGQPGPSVSAGPGSTASAHTTPPGEATPAPTPAPTAALIITVPASPSMSAAAPSPSSSPSLQASATALSPSPSDG